MPIVLLLILCLVLGGVIVAELRRAPAAEESAVTMVSDTPTPAGERASRQTITPPRTADQMPPVGRYDVIAERPLFVKARRLSAAAARPTETEGSPPPWRLLGTVTSAADGFAVISPGAGRDAATLRVGETLDGWHISAIAPDHIVLMRDSRRQRLDLDRTESALTSSGRPTRQSQSAPAASRPDD